MTSPLRCPRCRTELAIVGMRDWQTYRCPDCDGVAITMALLRRFAPAARVNELWRRLPQGGAGDPCPSCSRPLAVVRVPGGGNPLAIDVCRPCQFLWFDARELAAFSPGRQEPHAPRDDLSPRARAALSAAQREVQGAHARDGTSRVAESVVEALFYLFDIVS